MSKLNIFALICVFVGGLSFSGCQMVVDKVATSYLKNQLIETCGNDSPECKKVIERDFDKCHKKHEKDWWKYLESDSSKENEYLRNYSTKLYSCLVDEDGDPYFEYDPTVFE